MAAYRIVVIDDSPANLKVARFALESAGCEVRSAEDAATALEVVRTFHPHLVLLDLRLPNVDALALADRLKAESTSPVPLIVAVTALPILGNQEQALRAHCDGLLTRPLDPLTLALRVGELLGRAPAAESSGASSPVSGPADRSADGLSNVRHRVEENELLLMRWVLQEAQLAVLAGVAEVLAQNRDLTDVLQDVLGACLDISGISKGALYLTEAGRLTLLHQLGFDPAELPQVRALFGCEGFLAEVASGGKALLVPSLAVPAEAAVKLIQGSHLPSLLLVPVGRGGTSYGLMVLGAKTENVPGDDAQAFARVLGAQMGQAIGLTRAFRNLAASELRYRTLTENANDAICVLSANGIIREANPRLSQILGYPLDQLIGRPINSFAAVGRPSETSERPTHAGRPEQALELPHEFQRRDGSLALMEFSTALVEIGGESLVYSIGREMTDQVRAQAQLMAADRMVSLGTLAAGVAHEINNPLAAIVGNLEFAVKSTGQLVAQGGSSPSVTELQEALADARDAAQRVRQIVSDLKLFSRAEEDRRTSVDTRQILESTLRMATNEIRHRAHLVKSYGEVPFVEANESRLGQVFLNLIVNAAQAIPEGSADSNEIRITTRLDPSGRVVVEVRDTGPGIPPETLKHLFTPFFTTKPAGVGTGLGLAICQRIVNSLDGEIVVESEVGVGTAFKVFLNPARSDAEEISTPLVKPAGRRGRVLLVDDDPMVGNAVRRILSPEHEVVVFSSAGAALADLRAGRPYDVILCDMMMPVLTGMDFYEQLREMSPSQAERVIFLTGGAFTVRAREFLDGVKNTSMDKPFEVEDLRSLVNERIRQLPPPESVS